MTRKRQDLLFDINEYKSKAPKIKLIADEKFYKFFRRKYVERKISVNYKSKLRATDYNSYLKFEKKAKITALGRYTKIERFIIFLHFQLGYGRRKIHKLIGISERRIYTLLYEIK